MLELVDIKRKVLRKLLTKFMLYSTGSKNTVELLKVLIVKYSIRSKSTVEVGVHKIVRIMDSFHFAAYLGKVGAHPQSK